MEDGYGLLNGSGKVMKVLSVSDIHITQIQYYVDQAIVINARK
jgi:hypothetical protein